MNGLGFGLAVLFGFGGALLVHLHEHGAVLERERTILELAQRIHRLKRRVTQLERDSSPLRAVS